MRLLAALIANFPAAGARNIDTVASDSCQREEVVVAHRFQRREWAILCLLSREQVLHFDILHFTVQWNGNNFAVNTLSFCE